MHTLTFNAMTESQGWVEVIVGVFETIEQAKSTAALRFGERAADFRDAIESEITDNQIPGLMLRLIATNPIPHTGSFLGIWRPQ